MAYIDIKFYQQLFTKSEDLNLFQLFPFLTLKFSRVKVPVIITTKCEHFFISQKSKGSSFVNKQKTQCDKTTEA